MRSLWLLPFLCVAALAFQGCAMPSRGGTSSSTRAIRSDGTVGVETRSALSGSTEPGSKQEILGVYIPFLGTGLAIKAGLEYDPGAGGVITIPIGGQSAPATYATSSSCGAPQATSQGCGVPQTVTVQREVLVEEPYVETETRQVQKTRLVKRVVSVPATAVPIPAPPKGPCDPPPPEASVPAPRPAAVATSCPPGGPCDVPRPE